MFVYSGTEVGASVGDIVGVQVGGKAGFGVEDAAKVMSRSDIVIGGSGFKRLCGFMKIIVKSSPAKNVPAINIPARKL